MKIARPTKFAHVVYRTRRLKEMLAWYAAVFDAHVQYQNPALAFLTYDDEHHRLAFADMSVIAPNSTGTDKSDAIGIDHVAYTYASLGDLLENYSALKEKGITPYWCVHHGITVSMYYADPDGNQIEFQVDRCGSGDEATDFMNTNWGDNPVGVEYDPDELLSGYRAGTPETDLLSFYNGGPVSPLRGTIENLIAI
ncbi:MAG TPA: VOC family protein [Pyrinomonadaceae bacterium]|nr:VOC family protein [Pyrinomonadaceae bacterium]HMP65521.1 VOC family protein [Pyrinomonadaceae bacterium]